MLQISNVDFSRGDNHILYDFSLQAAPSELVYIRGANGAGKTTLLKIVAGVLQPNSGKITWSTQPIEAQNPSIYLGHATALKSVLTVEENLSFYQAIEQSYSTESKPLVQSIEDALEWVGLSGFSDRVVHSLSAGQTKRAALARLALTKKPLLIIDEPLNALDKNSVAMLEKLIQALCTQQNKTVLLTSHQDLQGLAPTKTVELLC